MRITGSLRKVFGMTKTLPPNPNLEYEKKQAKALLKAARAGDPTALERIRQFHPRLQQGAAQTIPPDSLKLSDAHLVIAREYGLSSWPQLKTHIEILRAGLTQAFTQFADAVQQGDTAQVQQMLAETPALAQWINQPVIGFDAPPIVVAAGHSRSLVDTLLKHGADINAKSVWWAGAFGALHGAQAEMAQHLIERGITVDIHAAVEQGLMDRVRQLLDADPSLIHAPGPDGQHPLHFARSEAMVDFLLAQGADLEARDVDHCGTAAQWMVGARSSLARYLLQRGAQPDIYMACALGERDLVQRLIDADPDVLNRRIGQANDPQVLRAPGLHIYVYSLGDNQSPHHVAAHAGHIALYHVLMERSSPLRQFVAACERMDLEAARSFLKTHPDMVRSLSPQDQRLLADAAWGNRLEAVRMMLEAGFDPQVRGADESTPLDRAAFHGFIAVIRLLLQHNPPLHLTNAYGGTPLETALYGSTHSWRRDGDFPATVEALIQAGAEVRADMLPSGNEAVDAVLRRYLL
jgi:ankyrin repeat protein